MARVLLVDDEIIIRRTLQEFLLDDGHVVHVADNAQEALRLMDENEFDVLLTDIILPKVSGIELIKQVRESYPTLKVILITGEPTVDTASEAVRLDAFDYLAKPVPPDALRKVVRSAALMKKLEDDKKKLEEENALYQRSLHDLVGGNTADLLSREKQFRSLVENSPDIFTIVDKNLIIKYVSPSIRQLMGWTPDDLAGTSAPELIHKDDHERASGVFRKLLKRPGETFILEHKGVCADGVSLHLETTGRNMLHDSVIQGIILTTRDLTRQKQSEDALIRSEQLYRSTIDAMAELLHVVDKNLRVALHNSAAGKWWTDIVPDGDWRGRDIFDLFPFLPEKIRDEYQYVFNTGKILVTEESSMVEEKEIITETRKIPIVAGGEVALVVTIIGDITERKHLEAERYHLFKVSIDMMCVAGFDGYFKQLNPSWEKTLGWSSRELLDKSWLEFVHPDDHKMTIAVADDLRKGRPLLKFRNRYRCKDGSYRWLSWNSFPVPEEKLMYAVARDITDIIKAEEEKRAMEVQLRQHQKLESLGTLASGVAHEINNPINGIMNLARLISDKLDAKSGLEEYSELIISESERIAGIVKNLLAFARQEMERHSPVHVRDIVERTLSLIRSVMEKDQIQISIDIPDGLPKIKCRSQQIQQVLMNLFTNARDALNERFSGYNPDKMIKLSARFIDNKKGRYIRLTVEDYGVGIDSEISDRIYDPFFTTKSRDQGTGLGLSVSYGIIKEHGGELSFESEPERGTRFHVELPVDNGWSLPPSN